MPILVFGARGLIGSSITKHLPRAEAFGVTMPWADLEGCKRKFDRWEVFDEKTQIVWAAGASSVSSSPANLKNEIEIFDHFLRAVERNSQKISRILLVSSAGGVYGSSPSSMISESDATYPMSDYGLGKLQLENELIARAQLCKFSVILARVSNAYGAGQNMNKKQGLISALIRASLDRKPVTIFVPLDTRRDYVYSDDIGIIVSRLMKKDISDLPKITCKIIASGNSTSVSELVGKLNRIRGIRTPIIFATQRETSLQPRSLIFRSNVLPELDEYNKINLLDGMNRVMSAALQAKQSGFNQ